MSNVTQRIDNFIEGVSQQSPRIRHAEQLETQVNGYSTEAGGLQKRPPTVNHGKLFNAEAVPYYAHLINRDEQERYIVLISSGKIRVFTLDGTEMKVEVQDAGYISNLTKPYSQLKVITVADYTFVLNKGMKARMSGNRTEDTMASQGCLINVKQGQYGRTYKVWINGQEVASYETPNGSNVDHVKNIATDYIRDQLASQIRSKGWTVDTGSSWLRVRGNISSIDTADSFNNLALVGITSYTNKFTNLPASAPDGYTVLVRGESNADDNYYVKYSASERIWKETVKTGIDNTINNTTMPHALIRQSDGTFVFKALDWEPRRTGDETSNEVPSFINNTINDLFFYRNRLGFLSGENIILSSSSDLFNFWMQSVVDVQDDDTIDTNAPNNKVSILYNAIPFSGSLYIFSGQTQFALASDGTLSPKNARLDSITEFTSDTDVIPVGAGNSVYFVSKRADFASVNEYRVAQYYTDTKDAEDVTAHVPYYIPNDVYKMTGSSNDNLLFVMTTAEPNTLYVYKYLYLNGNRVQSAWSKWTFSGEIIGADFIGSSLYMAVKYANNEVYLESITMSYNTEDYRKTEKFRVMLDRKTEVTLTTDNCEDKEDGYLYLNVDKVFKGLNGSVQCITEDGLLYESDTTTLKLLKRDSVALGHKVIIGIPYTFEMTLSTIYLKEKDQQGSTVSSPDYRLMLRTVFFDYAESGYMRVIVNDKYKYVLTNKRASIYKLSTINFETGTFKVPVRRRNTETTIKVINDTPLPLSIIGGGYEANYTARFKNV